MQILIKVGRSISITHELTFDLRMQSNEEKSAIFSVINILIVQLNFFFFSCLHWQYISARSHWLNVSKIKNTIHLMRSTLQFIAFGIVFLHFPSLFSCHAINKNIKWNSKLSSAANFYWNNQAFSCNRKLISIQFCFFSVAVVITNLYVYSCRLPRI